MSEMEIMASDLFWNCYTEALNEKTVNKCLSDD